jgi:hypothetical protein
MMNATRACLVHLMIDDITFVFRMFECYTSLREGGPDYINRGRGRVGSMADN